MTHRDIARLRILILIAFMLVGINANTSATSALRYEAEHCVCSSDDDDRPTSTPSFEFRNPCIALSLRSESSQGVSPIVRTLPRTLRLMQRTLQNSVAIRSIDSTTAAHRYGLYNHKILFYAHPRHYYLNGLVRLII